MLLKDVKEDVLVWRDISFSWMGQLSMRRGSGFPKSVRLVRLCVNFQLEFLRNLTDIF